MDLENRVSNSWGRDSIGIDGGDRVFAAEVYSTLVDMEISQDYLHEVVMNYVNELAPIVRFDNDYESRHDALEELHGLWNVSRDDTLQRVLFDFYGASYYGQLGVDAVDLLGYDGSLEQVLDDLAAAETNVEESSEDPLNGYSVSDARDRSLWPVVLLTAGVLGAASYLLSNY